MTDVRGLAQTTVLCGCNEACRFLGWLGERATREKLFDLTLIDVDSYIKDRATSLCRISLKGVVEKMRSFLRWLHMTRQTARDLSSTVIAPSIYAHESIPCAIRAEDAKKVLAAAQGDITPKGLRDYAILQLLSTYGVRAGEISALRLEDVDWRKEILRIRHSKTGATSYLPLLSEVGEAVLRYLENSRPKTHFREIFIRCKAPYRPFTRSAAVHGLVSCRIVAAGVSTTGKHGPHIFRHARAVSLLRAMVPMKQIGDLLGHRSADSTVDYLKLATEDLRAVAMEIPTGVKA
jgi:site-specific recombinase XerD